MPLWRKLWFQSHWLIGITAGVILAIVGITGALLAFEQQLLSLLNLQARTVEARGARLSPPELVRRIEQQGFRVTSLTIPVVPTAAARVDIAAVPDDSGFREETRYLDPYTAQWKAPSGTRGEPFFRATRDLHRWLIVSGAGNRHVGRQIIGACTLLLVLLALSGLYLRWPKRVSNWRCWLIVDSRLKGRGFLWSLHAVIGTFVLVPYLFLALTGLYWSYDWYRAVLYRLAEVEQTEEEQVRTGASVGPGAVTLAWSAFEQATDGSGYGLVSMRLPTAPARPIEFRYLDTQPAHVRAFNTLTADPASGAVLGHERYADQRLGKRLLASMFALHTGSFFGIAGSLVLMLASLVLPVSAVTGWIMYIERRAIRARRPRPDGIRVEARKRDLP